MSEPAADRRLPDVVEALTAAEVLDSLATGFIFLDPTWRVAYINAAGEQIVGRARAWLLSRNFWEEFPGTRDSVFGDSYRLATATREPIVFEAYYPGLEAWFEVRAVPLADGLGIYFTNVSLRHALQAAAEAKAQQLALLSDVSRELSSFLDAHEAVGHLAQLMVPTLADWCVVTMVGEHGDLHDLGTAHRDPHRHPDVLAYADAQIPAMTDAAPIWQVLRTGAPVIAPTIRAEVLEVVFPDPAVRRLLQALDPTSGLAVPLAARGSQLGVIALWNSGDRAPHTPEEIELALDIGRRAGLALDNSSLYARERRFSRALQTSLLTAPPTPAHCEIAVRYVPAAHEVQVGGDWYDAFCTATDATVLAIGDVVGHDAQATATMGQVRGLLRGIGFTTGDFPAALINRLDAAIDGLGLDAMATMVVVRLQAAPDDLARGVMRMQWSNAGHLPPVVLEPDGSIHVLDAEGDLLLGVDPTSERTEHVAELSIGSTVLLYTDGLIERRGAHLDDSIDALSVVLESLAGRPLEELCDEILTALVGDRNEDDVAILAVRIHA